MTALRQLSAIYVLAASSYAVAIVLSQHPQMAAATHSAARFVAEKGQIAAVALNDEVLKPGWAFARDEGARAYHAAVAELNSPKPDAAKPRAAPVRRAAAPPKPVAASTKPQRVVTLDIAPQAKHAASKPVPPKATPPAEGTPSAANLARVEQRLKDSLTSDLYANFDLFLYVSKAANGPLAQRMYVFAKDDAGKLALRDNWPVSTGREKVEYNEAGLKLPSYTPKGYYELDPHRMYRHYRSMQWGAPMPYAMFFNWEHGGYMTGLAIHAAQRSEIQLLGQRASAGCIRLAPEDARVLFDLIRTQYKGQVPRFAYNRRTHTMANDGMLMRGAGGKLRFRKGYRVLVVIENYGGENVVAALM